MKVEHDPEHGKFFVNLESEQAVLEYERAGQVLDFRYVYVPPKFRNRGLAGKIVIHAFEYAEKGGFKVIPTCPFVSEDFLPRFPQYQKFVQ